jgi:hypothetical protein
MQLPMRMYVRIGLQQNHGIIRYLSAVIGARA